MTYDLLQLVCNNKCDIHCGVIVHSGDHVKRLHDCLRVPSSPCSSTIDFGLCNLSQLEHVRLVSDMLEVKGILTLQTICPMCV